MQLRTLMGAAAVATLTLIASMAIADDFNGSPVVNGDLVQIVVDADDGLSDAEVKEIGQGLGIDLTLNSVHSDPANLYIAWVPQSRLEAVLDAIEGVDGIEYAEPNMRVEAFGAPNDPLYQYQWHFKQINAESAWARSSGKGVTVAVIDTGVAWKDNSSRGFKMAPDLKGTPMANGYDFVDDDKDPFDEHGHGTHVAGTIAQTTNNKYGVAGLAHSASIMPIRVLNKNGFGSVSDIADGIRYSADNGAKVINMSLGGPLPSLTMRSAIRYAHSKGVTIVAAAGNSGRRMRSYPAAYKHVIAVAATQYDKKTTFYSQWGEFVDIAAPGGNTRVDQNNDGRPDGVMQQTLKRGSTSEHDFSLYMGTSMACPHVAGAAAMIIGEGTTNPDKVEKILKDTANTEMKGKVGEYSERYGAGILDVDAATSSTTWCSGLTRLGSGLLAAFLIVLGVRRRDLLSQTGLGAKLPFVGGLVMASSGLFFLTALLPDTGALGMVAGLLGRPLAMLDLTLLGPDFHQNALLASALIPLAAVIIGLGNKWTRSLAAGLALGFAGFLFAEAFMLNADVAWVPGMDLLDRSWLAINGLASLGLGYLSLKRY